MLVVRRLRLADGEPMALEDLHVPGERAPGLHGDDLDGDVSFYRLLRERYGRHVRNGRQTVAPRPAAADAELLDVAAGAPPPCVSCACRATSTATSSSSSTPSTAATAT